MVSRMLRGVFNSRPPQPCYKSTWKVSTVLDWISSETMSNKSLLFLSMKLTTLLALFRLCWSADLAGFQLSSLKFTPEGATFMVSHLAKQNRPGQSLIEFFFPSLPDNPILCPVSTLQEYILRTKQFIEGKNDNHKDRLFITTTGGHSPATSATIARWIKSALTKAGVDTSIFKAHSVRGAITTAAALAGISITEILEAGDWSSQSFFERFYYRPHTLSFGQVVYLWLLTCKVEM